MNQISKSDVTELGGKPPNKEAVTKRKDKGSKKDKEKEEP